VFLPHRRLRADKAVRAPLVAALCCIKFGWHFLPSAAIDRWMHDATDMDLLRQYADGNSDATFTFPKTV